MPTNIKSFILKCEVFFSTFNVAYKLLNNDFIFIFEHCRSGQSKKHSNYKLHVILKLNQLLCQCYGHERLIS